MKFLESYASLIEQQLSRLELPNTPTSLYAPQRYILSNGGKRIRPILVLMSCGLCGGQKEDALSAGTAVELLHNFTLMHDDIMDQAESRRGEECVHIRWDTPSAILAGDGMFVQAMLQLQNLPSDVDFRRITRIFLEGINTVCEGQAMDMEFEQRDDVTEKEYLAMIEGKTGALIRASMQIGALCASADDQQVHDLGEMGTALGLAFQIQDDWLDVTGSPETFGKRKAGDIYEGKKTILMLNALDRCTTAERDQLHRYLGDLPMSGGQVENVLAIYQRYNIIEEAQKKSRFYYQKAEETLQKFDESEYKRDLSALIQYLKNREI